MQITEKPDDPTLVDDELFAKIKQFVSGYLLVNEDRLNHFTCIEKDLGCTGDDAVEFMAAFAKEFQVDLSAFKFGRHFESEGFDPIGCVLKLLFNWEKNKKVKKTQVSLLDLKEAAVLGKWIEKD